MKDFVKNCLKLSIHQLLHGLSAHRCPILHWISVIYIFTVAVSASRHQPSSFTRAWDRHRATVDSEAELKVIVSQICTGDKQLASRLNSISKMICFYLTWTRFVIIDFATFLMWSDCVMVYCFPSVLLFFFGWHLDVIEGQSARSHLRRLVCTANHVMHFEGELRQRLHTDESLKKEVNYFRSLLLFFMMQTDIMWISTRWRRALLMVQQT